MPRKTDGIVYELYPRPTNDEEGKPLLYARPVVSEKHDIGDLDDFCARYRGTSRGDMKRFFELFKDVATLWLRQGHRVDTPFGSLAPKLRLIGDHSDPQKVTGKDIVYAGLEFIPSKEFVYNADCSLRGFRRQEHNPNDNEKAASQDELYKALRKSINRSGYTTVARFMFYSGMKCSSARNFLNGLCKGDNPLLIRFSEGRNIHYTYREKAPNK